MQRLPLRDLARDCFVVDMGSSLSQSPFSRSVFVGCRTIFFSLENRLYAKRGVWFDRLIVPATVKFKRLCATCRVSMFWVERLGLGGLETLKPKARLCGFGALNFATWGSVCRSSPSSPSLLLLSNPKPCKPETLNLVCPKS